MRRLSRREAVMAFLLAPLAATATEAPEAALERHLAARLGEALRVQAIRRFGAVTLVDIVFAVRANSHEQLALVAADGTVLLVADVAEGLRGEVQGAPGKLLLDAGSQRLVNQRGTADGGRRFVFAVPVHEGCRACAIVGMARIAIDVDAEGRMTRSLHLRTAPVRGDDPWAGVPPR